MSSAPRVLFVGTINGRDVSRSGSQTPRLCVSIAWYSDPSFGSAPLARSNAARSKLLLMIEIISAPTPSGFW